MNRLRVRRNTSSDDTYAKLTRSFPLFHAYRDLYKAIPLQTRLIPGRIFGSS